jgi:hypothetical protein
VNAVDVLRRLAAAGCKAEVDPAGRLLVRPAYLLTDDLRAIIRRERDGIVRELRRREVEAALAAACRRLQLPWERLRQHPRGVTDEDIDEFCEGWSDYNNPALLEAFCRSVAHRLMLDRMPAINERAA